MILFHDVDGCLNGTDGKPLGFSADALSTSHAEELAELGALIDASSVEHFVLNTGRSWQTTQYLCETIGSAKARYALVEHGAALWDLHTQTSIDLHKLAERSRMHHVTTAINSLERVSVLIDWYQNGGNQKLADSIEFHELLHCEADQNANLTFAVPAELDGDAVMAALQAIISADPLFQSDAFVYHHSRSDRFIDVMGQMDKGLGVEVTIEHLRGHHSPTAAVGNGLNDLPMLRSVNLPICPANAEQPVREACARDGLVSSQSFVAAVKDWLRKVRD